MNLIFALVAAYFALLVGLSLVAKPYRQRMAVLADDLLRSELKPSQKHTVKAILATSYSMRAAPIHLLALIISLLTPSERFDSDAREWAAENNEMVSDARWSAIYDCHTFSVVAVNPIFGALLILARMLFRLKAIAFAKRHRRADHLSAATLEMYGELRAA